MGIPSEDGMPQQKVHVGRIIYGSGEGGVYILLKCKHMGN